LPESKKQLNTTHVTIKNLLTDYYIQFKNFPLIMGGLLMGTVTCFIYSFATITPFIAEQNYKMSSFEYGLANLLPTIGLLFGSFISARMVQKFSLHVLMAIGILIAVIGSMLMRMFMSLDYNALYAIFLPTILINFGLCFIVANASTIALSSTRDKSHGSAVMNFVNMGFSTSMIIGLGYFSITSSLLPILYMFLSGVLILCYQLFITSQTKKNYLLGAALNPDI
jgi:DHA1 family bicyclomycin/chloramphenicol resistance-like MFS transporter